MLEKTLNCSVGAILFALIGCSFVSVPANAQTSKLEERVSTLEKKVKALENNLEQNVPHNSVDSGPLPQASNWKNIELWRSSLSRGMSESQVRELFGEPDKIAVFTGGSSIWHYGYPEGGHVNFDHSGRVSSWSEP